MKKIYLILAIIGMLINNSIAQQTFFKAPVGTNTTTSRAPNGTNGHGFLRGCFLVKPSELTGIATVTAINGFGFNLTRGTSTTAVTGTIQVYFQNTSDVIYQKGTSWATAITGMTSVYNSTMVIPISNTPTVINMMLPSDFTYTGGGIYVAYDWVSTAPFEASANIAGYESESTLTQGGASNNSPTSAPTTLGATNFRPNFNFGYLNTFTNEASIVNIFSHGKIPMTMHSPYSFSVVVKNNASVTMNNVGVDLSMSGANTFTNNTIIPSIAAGATLNVALTAFTPTAYGLSTITISLLPDENNFNNTATTTQTVNCDVLAIGPSSVAPISYSAGVGFQTGNGIIYTRFRPTINSTVVAANIAISSDGSNLGKQVYAVLGNSAGNILATSNTITISSQHLNKFVTFFFPNAMSVLANTNYHMGLAQPTFPHFPIGSTPTNYILPNYYYSSTINGFGLSAQNQNLGTLGIETVYNNGMPVTVNSETICSGNSVTLTASGASTYSWTTGATTNSIVVAPNTTTMYVVTGYSTSSCYTQKNANVLVNITPTITVPDGGICPAPGSHTFVPSGASTYTFSGGSATVSPVSTTVYTVVGTSTAGCVSSSVFPTVYVQNGATVTILGPTSVCAGKSATLTGSGAVSYSWSTGSTSTSIVITPSVANTYAVLGTIGTCTNYVSTLVTINPNPTINAVASAPAYCLGGVPVSIVASGATTYTWNTGAFTSSVSVTPTLVTTYSVGGTDANGCQGSKLVLVAVYPSPTITAISSTSLLCLNETATVTADGGNNYTWSNNTSTTSIALISPTATTIYTVTGYAASGCSSTYTFSQAVDPCVGVREYSGNLIKTSIFPNPNNGMFQISISAVTESTSVELYNNLGQLIYSAPIRTNISTVNLSEISNGVYLLKVREGSEVLESLRVIKQ